MFYKEINIWIQSIIDFSSKATFSDLQPGATHSRIKNSKTRKRRSSRIGYAYAAQPKDTRKGDCLPLREVFDPIINPLS